MIPPIYATSTYKQDGVGGLRGGYEYSRSANPTRTALEGNLAALEEGERGFAFASGLAAEDTLVRAVCRPGDHVVIPDDAYGGTFRLFDKVERVWGLEHSPAAVSDVDGGRAPRSAPGETKLVWVETPTNPLLNIGDIAALAARRPRRRRAAGRRQHVRLAVPPAAAHARRRRGRCTPRRSTAAATPTSSAARSSSATSTSPRRSAFHQNAMGAVAGPFDAWLTLRGLKTLGVRMDRHCDNAERIVDFLDQPPRGRRGDLPRAWTTTRATRSRSEQMKRFGGMVSFRVTGGEAQALAVCERTEVFTLGESLGGVESLIEHPGRMTHASVAGTDLEVPADLVRLSVGIETVDDLIADLDRALD